MTDLLDEAVASSDSSPLAKQRRGLIFVSLSILALSSTGAQTISVSWLNESTSITRPWMIPIILWGVFVYLFVRYLQYLGAEEELWRTISKRVSQRAGHYLTSRFKDSIELRQHVEYSEWFFVMRSHPSVGEPRDIVAWAHFVTDDDPPDQSNLQSLRANEIGRLTPFWHHLRATLFVMCWRPLGTDYFLPVIFAIGAAVLGISLDWFGSPSTLLRVVP